jgi:bleomycin hydrolase
MLRILCIVAILLVSAGALAQDAVYREKNTYPVLDEMREAREARDAARDSFRTHVEAEYKARREAELEGAMDLRPDWSGITIPSGPEAFKAAWHNPPVAQYYTGTCWAYCTTSFLESEARRLHGTEVKLSEMWFVYWEYVAKATAYLTSFGATSFGEGSQDHGVLEVLAQYGAVTQEAYPGVLAADGRHDHGRMAREIKSYMDWAVANDYRNLPGSIEAVRGILDSYMGRPPEDLVWKDLAHTPRSFAKEVLKLDPADYVSCVSRMNKPFYTRVLLDVPDNWRRRDDYLNLPLADWTEVLTKALEDGFTLVLGGDNSEPGMDGLYDAAIVPQWDIPADRIDQAAREFRITNRTTGDDHGVHAVGITRLDGCTWLLIKDSNRSSRLGRHEGYYFWDRDYARLKMLGFLVHQDRLKGLLD